MRDVLAERRCLICLPGLGHRRPMRRTAHDHKRINQPQLPGLPGESLRLSGAGYATSERLSLYACRFPAIGRAYGPSPDCVERALGARASRRLRESVCCWVCWSPPCQYAALLEIALSGPDD